MNIPLYNEQVAFEDKTLWQIENAAMPASIGVVIASTADFPLQKGTVMGKVTATGKYLPYVDGAVDGTGTAVGLLNEHVDELRLSSTNQDVTSTIGVIGVAIEASCVGLDAAAKVDLKTIVFV